MFSSLVNRLLPSRKMLPAQTRRRWARPTLERLEQRELLAAFTAGDLVVSRIGTGAGPLTSAATATFLDEYNPTTLALVQSIALATTGNTATISTATEAGTTVTITTAAGHGFAAGQSVVVAGV